MKIMVVGGHIKMILELNKNQKELLESILLYTQENLSMEDTFEYATDITEILEKLKNGL